MENKTSKYLKYAIGEIILVIIGILIALAISDWNGRRIEKTLEINKLEELKKGLLIDRDAIKKSQLNVADCIEKINELQSLLKNPNMVYQKDLDSLFGVIYGLRLLNLNMAFYEDLKSSGLDLIKDENIRLQIVQLFENNYKHISGINTIEHSINEVIRPYYLTHFHNLKFGIAATPKNFNSAWTDSYFHNIIDYRLISLNINQVTFYSAAVIAIEKLTAAIDMYLDQYQ